MPQIEIDLTEEENSRKPEMCVTMDADRMDADIRISIGDCTLLMTWAQIDALYHKLHDWLKPETPQGTKC